MESSIIVVSNIDGKKYKMVMKGDLTGLPVRKIKRYLNQATGIECSEQILTFNNRAAPDDATGSELGLYDGAVVFLDVRSPQKLDFRMREDSRRGREVEASNDHDSFAARQFEQVERTIQRQQVEIDQLKHSIGRITATQPSGTKVERLLEAFAVEIQSSQPVVLDMNHTAVVPVSFGGDHLSILVTHDPASERLYMYCTVLSSLPRDLSRRLELYELLLEGALLGREMAGGGVGISVKSELVLLSVSIDSHHSDDQALAAASRPFVAAVHKWTNTLRQFGELS